MTDALTLRLMTKDEVDRLVGWAADEGWNPGLHDADIFWEADPEAFVAAEVDREVIGGGAIASYDGAFEFMGLFGVPLNFANIIVMPLIFGIGVDAGVHMVHRWRQEPYGRPAGLSGGTGRGISLTMASTMIGFGCMLLAEHRGIRSLGFVMLAGLGVCLLACYTVLPPVLRLRTLHWATEEATSRRE